MAVLAEAISVVVRKSTVVQKYEGGWNAFVHSVPNATLCTDGELVRVGFTHPDDVGEFVRLLEARGLRFLRGGESLDIVVVDQQRGPTTPCRWIQFGPLEIAGGARVSGCWFSTVAQSGGAEGPTGTTVELAVPRNWKYDGSLSQAFEFVPTSEVGDRVERVGAEGGVEIVRDQKTGDDLFCTRSVDELIHSADDGSLYPAPPYAERRYSVTTGRFSQDFSPVLNRECWQRAFAGRPLPARGAWRSLWQSAGELLATGTDYCPERVALDIAAFYGSGLRYSVGTVINTVPEDGETWEPVVQQRLAELLSLGILTAAIVGIVVDGCDPLARPCLTMLVSGPEGGMEAATAISEMFAAASRGERIAVRSVRSDSVGVVKVAFAPEQYGATRAGSFGVDWRRWAQFAEQDRERHWDDACLIWCDSVIAAAETVRQSLPHMVDGVYFDFMRVVTWTGGTQAKRFASGEMSIADQFGFAGEGTPAGGE